MTGKAAARKAACIRLSLLAECARVARHGVPGMPLHLQALEINSAPPFNGVVYAAACLDIVHFTSLTSLSVVLPATVSNTVMSCTQQVAAVLTWCHHPCQIPAHAASLLHTLKPSLHAHLLYRLLNCLHRGLGYLLLTSLPWQN